MTIPSNWFRIVHATELQSGDFAILIEENYQPVLVGDGPRSPVAVDLGPYESPNSPTIRMVEGLEGYALATQDYDIEYDVHSCQRYDSLEAKRGALVASNRWLSVAGIVRRQNGVTLVNFMAANGSDVIIEKMAFTHWSITKAVGNRAETLYTFGLPT